MLYVAGGVPLIALGASVAILRPRLPSALAFAAVTIGMGLLSLATALDRGYTIWAWWCIMTLQAVGHWGFFFVFPRQLRRADALPAAVVATCALGVTALIARTSYIVEGEGFRPVAVALIHAVLSFLSTWGFVAVAFFLPVRAMRTPAHQQAEARALGIIAVGFAMFSAGTFADIARAARNEVPLSDGIFDATYVMLPVLLWLHVTRGTHGRVARNVILATTAIYVGSYAMGPAMAWAAGRPLGALLLAYAVLRGHMEGLDLKVRFAISRSTIAASFVAAFFLASEGAQIVFGRGNEWVGLLAAGALVFALAPLQRAAERLAEKAVPAGSSMPSPSRSRERAYRLAVLAAVDDGRLTATEEMYLAELAEEFGIGAGEALRLRRDVEQEVAAR